jgi:hypothetical protein
MPPSGGIQQFVAVDVVEVLRTWSKEQPEFIVGGNEAGMILGGDVRAADAAVWRRDALGEIPPGYLRVPPILAVEVAGVEEGEPELRAKAAWYLAHGVALIWLVLPATREVVVLSSTSESRCREIDRLAPQPALPGLEPEVREFFIQLAG